MRQHNQPDISARHQPDASCAGAIRSDGAALRLAARLVLLGAFAAMVPPAPANEPAEVPSPDPTDPTAPAAPAAPEGTVAAEPPTTVPNEFLESTRRSVRSTTEWLARGVDSWFGPMPFENGGKVSDGRFSVSLLKRQDTSADFAARFNVRLRMPNVERFGYVFVGRDDRRDVVVDTPAALSSEQRLLRERREDPAFVAGLGMSLFDAVDFRLGMRGGFKPYVQGRYSHSWEWPSGTVVEFRETVFWANDDRFGSTTALSLEHPLSSSLALRWLGATTITQDVPKFEWSSSMGAYQTFGGQRVLSLEVLTDGREGSGVGLSDYGVQLRWEQPVYRNWLRAEFLAGHFWPRPDAAGARGRAWAFGTSLKMRF